MSEHTPEPMTSNRDKMCCPVCGSQEVDATTPRTVYECNSSDYDQRPGTFKQSEICAEIAALRAQVEELRRERDLAIAHDRQPYPTVDAYEKVCSARTKWQNEAEQLRAQVEELKHENMVMYACIMEASNLSNLAAKRCTLELARIARKDALAATGKENV